MKNKLMLNNLIRNKHGDIDIRKISLLILGLFVLVGFVWLVSAIEEISTVTLNATSATNLSSENLTAYPTPLNASQKYIYNWKLDGSSITVLNMPFDGGALCSGNICDYSSYGYDGTPIYSPTYNSTGGFDGKGVYVLDGINQHIALPMLITMNGATEFTFTAWVYNENDVNFPTYDGLLVFGDTSFRAPWIYGEMSTKKIVAQMATTTGGNVDCNLISSSDMPNNAWTMITFTWDGTNCYLYFDNNLEASDTTNGSIMVNQNNDHSYLGIMPDYESWNGSIDEVQIFKDYLSAEQISALYNNQTNIIVSQETIYGDSWQACATPNNNVEDGTEVCSNTLAVENISVILNSTTANNYSTENLTAYVSGLVSGNKAIYDWKVDGNPVTVFNMPMDGGALCSGKVCDYSSYGYDGTPIYSPTYNSTGGFDGKGVYVLDGINQHIALPMLITMNGATEFTFTAWVYNENDGNFPTYDGLLSFGIESIKVPWIFGEISTKKIAAQMATTTGGNADCNLISSSDMPNNAWTMITFTWDGTNCYLYFDNNLEASDTTTGSIMVNQNNEYSYLGIMPGYESWNGSIDEVQIFKDYLSAEQISTIYNNNTDIIVSQETYTGEVWQTCVTPNDNVRDGTQICSNNITVAGAQIDSVVLNSSSGNNYTTDNLTATPVNMLPSGAKAIYNWKKNGNSIKIFEMTFDGEKLCNGGAKVCDYASGKNGTVTSATYYADGYDDTGYYRFDGTNDQISMTPVLPLTDSFSISAWVFRANLGGVQTIFETYKSTGLNQYVRIAFNSANKLHCNIDGGIISTTVLTDNEWHLVTCTYNWGTRKKTLYLDGVEEASSIATQDLDLSVPISTYIGRSASTNWYSGGIDEVVVWDMELSSEQVFAMYDNGNYRTDIIVVEETAYGEVWQVCATPNNNVMHGDEVCSNNLTIQGIDVALSSSSGTNYSNENLTASVSGLFGDDKVFYDWKVDGDSIAVLNMPMDGGALAESNTKVRDYSGNGNNGTVTGATYNSTGGYDRRGAFEFNGSNGQYISFPQQSGLTDLSMVLRIKRDSVGSTHHLVAGPSSGTNQDTFIITSDKLGFHHCGSSIQSSSTIDTEWHHVAVTRDYSANVVNFYIDGEFDSSGSCTTPTKTYDLHTIGSEGSSYVQTFNGTIDEVLIFDRTLSPEQVSALYNNQTNKIVSQETAYGDVWQVCATPNDNIRDGGTVCSNNLTVENIDVTLTSTDVSTNFSTENLSASVSGLIGSDNAIYDWRLDGSSIMALNMPFDGGALCGIGINLTCDYSSYANNGTPENGTIYNSTGGYNGKGAYEFDGVDDYLYIPDQDEFSIDVTKGFTVEARVYPTNLDNVSKEFIVTKGSPPAYEWQLQEGNEVDSSENVVTFVIFNTGDTAFLAAESNISISNNTWYHVVGVYEAEDIAKIYVNGVLENTDSTPNASRRGNSGARLNIGWREDFSAFTMWEGSIDEVKIYQRALSAEQISAMYNNGSYRTNIIVSDETLTDEDWKACVAANDGVRNGKQVCSSVLTVMANMTIETSVEPYVVTNGSSVTLNMSVLSSAEAVNATWANLTYPNTTVITINSFPYIFNNTNATGIYNVTFYANDTAGDRVSNDDYFESFVPVTFNFTIIDFNTIGVDSSWELYYRDEIIFSNGSSTGNHSVAIPDALSDLKIKSYTERLQITLEDINVTLENGKNFGMDRHTQETGYLVTYGVNNSYAFTNAVVRIYYDDLAGSYSTEGNLKLYKCDNYDFAGRSCSGTWEDITSSASQDTGSDYFEYNTTSFSGFSIKEVTPAAPVTGGGGGGADVCTSNWVCARWSDCIDNVQTRTCTNQGTCTGIADKPKEAQTCREVEGIPSQLFDITFNLDDKLIQSVNELSGVVTFESFGLEPTPVNLTFTILDEAGNEVYREESSITVITEEVLRWNYETLQDLPEGKYTAILETLYNVDVSDEFRQEFEIGEERGISLWIWIVGGIVVGGLIIWLIWRLIKIKKRRAYGHRREEPKSFKGKVSEILEEGRIKDEG